MTDQRNDIGAQLEAEIREGLAGFDEAVPELIAEGGAEQGVRALTVSRDALLAMADAPEWHAFVRRIFDARIDALREAAG